jgi:hypothetical protein
MVLRSLSCRTAPTFIDGRDSLGGFVVTVYLPPAALMGSHTSVPYRTLVRTKQSGPPKIKSVNIKRHGLNRKIKETNDICDGLRARQCKATLILAPSQATHVWKTEIRTYFPDLNPKPFSGHHKRVASSLERSRTLGSNILDLLKWLVSLPDSPAVALQPVICSYSTWAHRSTYYSTQTRDTKAKAAIVAKGLRADDLPVEKACSGQRLDTCFGSHWDLSRIPASLGALADC